MTTCHLIQQSLSSESFERHFERHVQEGDHLVFMLDGIWTYIDLIQSKTLRTSFKDVDNIYLLEEELESKNLKTLIKSHNETTGTTYPAFSSVTQKTFTQLLIDVPRVRTW